ncbi:hypothetical protein NQ318_007641 [Aromia moschata]|uniref:Uncharacterized protein n=1 Tax=Aromia moschata TaxID=1265417 RepID=A0AAV8XHX7_9CUCU|nr:hypothetical protein NQ318_007641 [Aromia moschata]
MINNVIKDNCRIHINLQGTRLFYSIQYWLNNKNIPFEDNQLKIQLLEVARLHKEKYVKYAVDKTAAVHGITVIRLLYHYELNPTELIWAQVKCDVGGNLRCHIESWQKCIGHVLKEEERVCDLDTRSEVLIEPLVIDRSNLLLLCGTVTTIPDNCPRIVLWDWEDTAIISWINLSLNLNSYQDNLQC